MRIRIAAALTVLGLAASACGTSAGSGVTTTSAPPSAHHTPSVPQAAGWVRIKDPSGVSFLFPTSTTPTLTTTSVGTTRTYLANAGSGAAISVVIVPTPIALNVKNFVVQYPVKLRADGNTNVAGGAITPVVMQGIKGFQTDVRYDSLPGPSHLYEQRTALQLAKYFIVISAVSGGNHALGPADIAQAKAINAQLVRGFLLRSP